MQQGLNKSRQSRGMDIDPYLKNNQEDSRKNEDGNGEQLFLARGQSEISDSTLGDLIQYLDLLSCCYLSAVVSHQYFYVRQNMCYSIPSPQRRYHSN